MRGNGVLEDIAAVIGFAATSRMVALFGPGKILVPVAAHAEHAITRAIGEPAMRRMVAEWGGQVLELPMHADFHHARLLRAVACMLQGGMSPKDISGVVGVTERHLRRLRAEAEAMGLLPLVLRAGGCKRTGRLVDEVA